MITYVQVLCTLSHPLVMYYYYCPYLVSSHSHHLEETGKDLQP